MSSVCRPGLRLRLLVCALLLVLPAVASSCANVAYNRAYQEAIEREVDDYRHQGSVEDLHRDVEAYLANNGYVAAPGTSPTVVESEWRAVDASSRRRLRVELIYNPEGLIAQVFEVWEEMSPQRFVADSLDRRADFEHELHGRLLADAGEPGDGAEPVYPRSADEIWAEVTRLAFDQSRMFVDPVPPIDSVAVSDWTESEGRRSRLEVRLRRRATNQYSVEVQERVERAVGERRWQPRSDQRDLRLELELIRLRDPLRAQQIETEAQEAGDSAYLRALDRGAIACHCTA